MNVFQNMFKKKKHVFWPKMASVTLHIPKDFWWHRIFGSATIFWVRKFWSTWSRGGGGARWSILADRLEVFVIEAETVFCDGGCDRQRSHMVKFVYIMSASHVATI